MDAFCQFPQEIEEGNIEYKRHISRLILDNPEKLIKFKTQLLWRLDEGKEINGSKEAVYYIGIEDDGILSNLGINELNDSIINFTEIVKLCGARIYSTQINEIHKYAKITIQKLDDYINANEITIGLLGPSDSGKSTFLGVLTYDIKDDGNGLARSNILRHNHEKRDCETSSIKYEIIGHNNETYINYNSSFIYSWEYIIKNSGTIVNFIDLPGNPKYLKTTIFGILSHIPDYILIFVSLLDMSNPVINSHIELCKNLGLPYSIIYTKKDLMQAQVQLQIKDITISNITGEGLDEVKNLIKNIKIEKPIPIINKKIAEFIINDIIIIPDIGIVLTGIMNQGRIKINNKLSIGPCDNTFYTVEIISIHKKQIPCKYLYHGETGTIIVKSNSKINITKHMMLITSDQFINFRKNFNIEIKSKSDILLKEGSKLMAFSRNIYDTVTINKIDKNILTVSYSNIQYIKQNEFIILRNNNELIFGLIYYTRSGIHL